MTSRFPAAALAGQPVTVVPPVDELHCEDRVRNGLRIRRFVRSETPPLTQSVAAAWPHDHTVAIVGVGRCGLETAAALVSSGHRVHALELDPERREQIAVAQTRFGNLVEPAFTLTAQSCNVAAADVVVICEPEYGCGGEQDELTLLATACADVVRVARAGQLILLGAAAYPGATNELIVEPLAALGFAVGDDINVAYSADHVGTRKTAGPPRTLGGATRGCAERAQRFLAECGVTALVVPDIAVAEMALDGPADCRDA